MVKFIEPELVSLKKGVDEMRTLMYNQLDRTGEAILTLGRELTQQVLIRGRHINVFELRTDSDTEDVATLYNPVAADLHFALAMLKINSNLERLGDSAESIVRFVINYKEPVLGGELLQKLRLEEMISQVLFILGLTKKTLQEKSQGVTVVVLAKDNLLNEINVNGAAVLAGYIGKYPESAPSCPNLVSVFRKLERSGDHIMNIAEEIMFFIDAKVLKRSGYTDEQCPNDKR